MKLIHFSTIIIFFMLCTFKGISQGCIAVRSMASANGNPNNTSFMHKGDFQVTTNYRHLHSYKHFLGDVEQTQRVEQGTEVINEQHNFDIGLTYAVSSRFNFSLNVPLALNSRSSLYEHYGNGTPPGSNPRFTTHSKGVGDMRLTANYWVLAPMMHLNGNFSVGVGIKAPTGDANVQDDFHKLDKNGVDYIQRHAVDQSIQLGDSGWGYSIEMQGYQLLFKNASLYYNGFYLFSPKELNSATNYSVPDQFGARIGMTYAIFPSKNIAISLGGRLEGLPAVDLIGGSGGARRPGYIISYEPGIIWSSHHSSLLVTIPVAVYRNRTPTWTAQGFKAGDAAFADYFISATYAYRF